MEQQERAALSPKELKELAVKLGIRRANLAAFYANVRRMLSWSLDEENPVVGAHGFYYAEDGKTYLLTAGATWGIDKMLADIGALQGQAIGNYLARRTGDLKHAAAGDSYNPDTSTVHCIGCEDGDPTGEHAKEELQKNARAWLGLTVLIAHRFYGGYLPDEAYAHLDALAELALPADAEVK